jgi:opacity protein-like surface antigen
MAVRTCSVPLVLALLLMASPVAAQEPVASGNPAVALARVPPGSTLRLQTVAGDVLEGPFILATDSVLLETATGRRAVAFRDVRSAWYPRRNTRRGAIAGALLGSAGGGAYMGLLSLVASSTGSERLTLLAIGILGGGAAGGLLGGVVGAAIPDWTLVYPANGEARPAPPSVARTTPSREGWRRIGSVDASFGYGRVGGDESTNGGIGGRVALNAHFGAEPRRGATAPFLTVGPELGWFDLGRTEAVRRDFPPADTLEFRRRYGAFTAGGVLRAGLASPRTRAYGIAGLAYNRWNIDQHDERWIRQSPEPPVFTDGSGTFEHIGYTVGAGVQATITQPAAFGIELRRTAVGTFDMDLPGSYWTVTVIAVRRW